MAQIPVIVTPKRALAWSDQNATRSVKPKVIPDPVVPPLPRRVQLEEPPEVIVSVEEPIVPTISNGKYAGFPSPHVRTRDAEGSLCIFMKTKEALDLIEREDYGLKYKTGGLVLTKICALTVFQKVMKHLHENSVCPADTEWKVKLHIDGQLIIESDAKTIHLHKSLH